MDRDPSMVQLRQYASTAWTNDKTDVSRELSSYWSLNDEPRIQDRVVSWSNCLIIPAILRTMVLGCFHAAYPGAEKNERSNLKRSRLVKHKQRY